MPAPVLHLGATVLCSHAGQAMPMSPFPRVMLSGQPAVNLTSPYAIAGCSLTGSAPPCVTGQMVMGAARVMIGGAPAATMMGQSVCTPTGTPMLPVVAQMRVMAT
ncbi:hypothetical protein [Bradyrhizobium sp.]|jgi:uncharacterized Zn-binding protein involved in type VI secretion|uniref:hypothetical protein n=1 Tax=Bradyrhizobium sp. TaxID=376 RepID=UPI002DDD1917|nr:hypothetical protein [Bradyrhizobium sp.]HEV2160400.1 hypothetical protein [Bradyrhizobium sp.]